MKIIIDTDIGDDIDDDIDSEILYKEINNRVVKYNLFIQKIKRRERYAKNQCDCTGL